MMRGLSYDFTIEIAQAKRNLRDLRAEVSSTAQAIEKVKEEASSSFSSPMGSSSDVKYLRSHPLYASAKIDAEIAKRQQWNASDMAKGLLTSPFSGRRSSSALQDLGDLSKTPGMSQAQQKVIAEMILKLTLLRKERFNNIQAMRREHAENLRLNQLQRQEAIQTAANARHKNILHRALVRVQYGYRNLQRALGNYNQRQRQTAQGTDTLTTGTDRLIRTIRNLAIVYAAYRGLSELFSPMNLFNAAKKTEQITQQSSIVMGSQANAYRALKELNEDAVRGLTAFTAEDNLAALKALNEVGLGKNNLKLAADMAGTVGVNVADAAEAINSLVKGNTGALEQFGVYQKDLMWLNKFQPNTPVYRQAVMDWLATNNMWMGGNEKMMNTWQGITNRFKSIWTMFTNQIMGDPTDKNSLYSKIKDTFKQVAEFLSAHRKDLMRIADGIRLVFEYLWQKVSNVVKGITGAFGDSLNKSDGFFANFQKNMMNFIVYLELLKIRIKGFWSDWGDEIITMGKILAGVYAVNKIGGLFGMGAGGFGTSAVGAIAKGTATALGMASTAPLWVAISATAGVGLIIAKLMGGRVSDEEFKAIHKDAYVGAGDNRTGFDDLKESFSSFTQTLGRAIDALTWSNSYSKSPQQIAKEMAENAKNPTVNPTAPPQFSFQVNTQVSVDGKQQPSTSKTSVSGGQTRR